MFDGGDRGVVVNGFEVFDRDFKRFDRLMMVQRLGYVPHQIFHKFWVVVRAFRDGFFVGAF